MLGENLMEKISNLILVESTWMYSDIMKRITEVYKSVNDVKKFHQKGYSEKRWEERDPDVIKKLIQTEKHLVDAYYLLEEITG